MLTNFLLRTFIKDHLNTSNQEVRKKYGILSGIIGIFINVLLFIVKFSIGLIVNSVSIMADSFNNLSDVFSSVVTILGFHLASKPADEEHPFGHGRIEYIAGLIVSFLIILIGYEFIKTSIIRILHPEPLIFNLTALLIIIFSILSKVWLAIFNRRLGLAINSHALAATSLDSLSDSISTACVAVALIASKWTTLPLDGYIGIIVSGIILYSGITQTKETISPLLGEASPPELAKSLTELVLSYDGVENVHDLIIHSYGPGRYMASIHAEVPADNDIMALHELIDKVEREVSAKLNLVLTIHMDPVNKDSAEIKSIKKEIENILSSFPQVISYHDFRMVGKGEVKNLLFDIVVKPGITSKEEQKLIKDISSGISGIHPYFDCIIHADKEYTPIP